MNELTLPANRHLEACLLRDRPALRRRLRELQHRQGSGRPTEEDLVGLWQAQRGGAAYSFDRYAVDARAFLKLGHRQRVLALRGYYSHVEPFEDAQVPFGLMAYLGGTHTLRGFLSQRFRGERLALLQVEYRWEASPALELALFVDYGTVAATSGDPLADFKIDGGIGLRLKTHESLMARLDLAWSEEAFRILLRFSPSF